MTTLAHIARDMETQATRTGTAERHLAGGLHLHLVIVAGQKLLKLSRADVPPGEREISICRGLFFVPTDARRRNLDTAVEFRWPSARGR